MKILVIFTGGTIGSSVNDGYIGTDNQKPYQLINMYNNIYNIEFITCSPYTVLSENMTCDILAKLVNCVKDNLAKDYDGIIVTHGTDTLQYSAATLGYCLGNTCIPVMLVSSNYVLDEPIANGLANFKYSVEFIRQNAGKGVFITYRNSDNITRIHRATRALPHQAYSDDVYSTNNCEYGHFDKDDNFITNTEFKESADSIEPFNLPNADIDWFSGVLRINPYTGFKYPALDSSVKCVLHESYHSGTVCSKSPDLAEFTKAAKELNIPIFLTGIQNGIHYESVKIYDEFGITILPQASPIAMYIKMWLCLVCDRDLHDTLSESLGGDLC